MCLRSAASSASLVLLAMCAAWVLVAVLQPPRSRRRAGSSGASSVATGGMGGSFSVMAAYSSAARGGEYARRAWADVPTEASHSHDADRGDATGQAWFIDGPHAGLHARPVSPAAACARRPTSRG